jgi:Tol biopolymer transport system component
MRERAAGTLVLIVCLLALAGCGGSGDETIAGLSGVWSQTGPGGAYLGQQPPGTEPEIFAPGVVSDTRWNEWSGTFSPDGREYYFYRNFEDSSSKMFMSRLADGRWTTPEPCAFTGDSSAGEPHLTFDNRTLYFLWEVAPAGRQPEDKAQFDYYFVQRMGEGWSKPQYAGQGMFMSSTRDGQIYTTDMSAASSGKTYLARVTTNGGVFTEYERLTIQPYYGAQAHPCIAPDGSYILFDVSGGCHLFVSFRQADGSWGQAIDLTKHGFDPLAGGAYVSPDGKYLFFALKDDIWWVDIQAVESLRPA